MTEERDSDIIELTDVVGDDSQEDDIIELTEIESSPVNVPEPADIPDPVVPVLTQEQVEAALERIIEKKFSEKIDAILFDVMEKVISKEIANIRKGLQEDLEQIGTS